MSEIRPSGQGGELGGELPPKGIVGSDGKPLEQKVKALEIWFTKKSTGERFLEIHGPPNKAMLIETLCDALKLASVMEYTKKKPVGDNGIMRIFKR